MRSVLLSGQSPPLPTGSGLRLWMRQNDSCGGFRDKPGVISFCVLTSRRLTTATSADSRTELNLVVAINCNHPVGNHHNTPAVVNNTFAPIAVETLGPLTTSACQRFGNLGRKISSSSGDNREGAFLFQRVSVLVQRFNAVLLYMTACQPLTARTDGSVPNFVSLYPVVYC